MDYTTVFFFYRAYTSNNKIILRRVVFYAIRVVSRTIGNYIFPEFLILQNIVDSLEFDAQFGRQRLCVCVAQWQDGSVIPSGIGFSFRRLLGLAGQRWTYSNPLPHGDLINDRKHLHMFLWLSERFGGPTLVTATDSISPLTAPVPIYERFITFFPYG
jgi:hypothetical protein